MMSMKKVELLSPAGDFEKLKMAVQYGADAVYFSGKQFGLRSFSTNFTLDEIPLAVQYAKENHVRAYMTLNIFAHQQDYNGLEEYIRYITEAGVDAVIVSDPGIFSLVRLTSPEMKIHISTQSSVTSAKSCLFWYKAGARRIVLARELTLDEIISIRKEVPEDLELEVFIHGAMCMTYSGRCLLSNYFSGRDANRGECIQPCRWKYTVTEDSRQDQPLKLAEDEHGSYLFSSKDLCMIEHIPQLMEAGIDSFKIEGRMKGVFYVATVTKAYREAINTYINDPLNYVTDLAWMQDLSKTVHRKFDTGFFFCKPMEKAQISYDDTYIREAKVVGIILSYDNENRRAIVEQRNKIFEGDKLEIVSPKGRHAVITAKDLRDENNELITSTPHAKMIYSMKMRIPVSENSFLRLINNKN